VIPAVFGDHTLMVGDTTRTRNVRILALCAVMALSACQKDSGTTAAANPMPQVKVKAPAPVKKGPSAAELTVGMVEAAAQGRTQGPVDLKFELVQRPKVGQPLEVNLALLPQIDADPATIEVVGADGLAYAPGSDQFEIPMVVAGEVYRHTLKFTPAADGLLLLGVTILLKHDEITDSRAFSIPIIVER
jgi:hypothetical protein